MAHFRRTLLTILSLTLALLPVAFTSPASARASSGPGATTALKSDTGWRVLRAKSGGTVYGPDNVSITVPPGVMKRDGKVSVQEIFPGVYNIHITPRWKGKVTVRLPMTGDVPIVAHKRHGQWVLERAHAQGDQAVAKVRSLSLFSAIRECVPKLMSKNPKAAVLNTVKCFMKHGSRHCPSTSPRRSSDCSTTGIPASPSAGRTGASTPSRSSSPPATQVRRRCRRPPHR